MKSQYTFSGNVAHDDRWGTSYGEKENYLPNTAATRSTSETHHRSHDLNPTLNADMRWAADSLNTFTLRASVEHKKKRSHSRQTEEQESQQSSDGYMPTLSQLVSSRQEGHTTKLSTMAMWEHYIKDGGLSGSVSLDYSEGKTNHWTERTVTSHMASLASSQLSQYATSPNSALSTEAQLLFSNWLTKKWLVKAQYIFMYGRNSNDCDFMTDGVADAANSYRDRSTNHSHSLRVGSTFNLATVQIMPNITAKWLRESLDYQRGVLDTTAVRHIILLQPDVRATWKLSKTVGFELNYGFSTSQPGILQTLGYRDLTDPLFITEGNPSLKDTHSHNIKLSYNMVLARSQTSLSASVEYKANDRDLVTALSYNPTTAIYVSRPENVRGSYGYPTLLPTQTERTLNRQNSLHPKDRLTLSLDLDWLKASAFAKIEADRLRFSASPEQNTTLWNNDFGINAEATVGKFVFESDITEITRRGYPAQSMNRNMLLWNAGVTWKILKNKARLKLEFEDILNKQDDYWSERSPYQHSTSWQDFRHHYVNLSFTYHLDAKKKD